MKIERKLFESSLKHIQNKNDTFIAVNPFFSDELIQPDILDTKCIHED